LNETTIVKSKPNGKIKKLRNK